MKMMVDNDTKIASSESLTSGNQQIKPKVLDVLGSSSTSAGFGNLSKIEQNSKEDGRPSIGSNKSQTQILHLFGGSSPSKISGNLASTQPEFGITHPQPSTSTSFKQSSAKSTSDSTTTPLGAFGSQSASSLNSNLSKIEQNSKEDGRPSVFGSNKSQTQTLHLFGGSSPSKISGNLASTQPEFGITHPQPSTSTSFKQSSTKLTSDSTNIPLGGFGSQSAISLFGQPASSTNTTRFGHFGQSSVSGQPINPGNLEQSFGPTKSIFGQPITHGNFGQSLVPAKSVFGQPINSDKFGQSFGPAKSVFGQPINPGMSISRYQPTFALDNQMDTSVWQSNYLWGMYHCITAMKEYESKSLEELRMEHYLAIGKLPKVGFGGFGTTNQPTVTAGLFITTSQPFPGSFDQSVTRTNENNGLFDILNNLAFGQTPFAALGASLPHLFTAKPTFGQTSFGQRENAFNSNTSHGGNFVLSHTVLYLNN